MVTHSIHVELCVAAQTSYDRRAGNRNQHNLYFIYYDDLFIKKLPPQTPQPGKFHSNCLQRCPLQTFCWNSRRPKDAVVAVSEEGRYFLDDSEIWGKILWLITRLGTLKPVHAVCV